MTLKPIDCGKATHLDPDATTPWSSTSATHAHAPPGSSICSDAAVVKRSRHAVDDAGADSTTLSARVRDDVARLLMEGNCTQSEVAAALGLHPRTLQRRLKKEGESYESIKDSVRREFALHYLRQRHVPLVRVAEILGYSEASVLSRSCHRWFSASPRALRKRRSFG